MASYLEKPVAIQRADVSYGAIELARLFDDVFSEGVVGTNDLKVQQYSGGARMSVEVAAGSAYVDFDTPDKGKYRVYNSALNDSGTPGAPNDDWEATFLTADVTNPRVDRVVLLVYDGNYDGTGKYKGVFKVIAGAPTAGATLVNLNGAAAVPSNAILLANVLIAAAATTIPTANIDTTIRSRSTVGSGAAQTFGVKYRSAAAIDVVNTAVETNILSQPIAAGEMGTDKMIRCLIFGDYLNDSGAARTFVLKILFGGTVIFEDVSSAYAAAVTRRPWALEFFLANLGTPSSQFLCGLHLVGVATAPTTGIGDAYTNDGLAPLGSNGPSAIDTALVQTLAVSVTHSVAHASLSLRKRFALVEVV